MATAKEKPRSVGKNVSVSVDSSDILFIAVNLKEKQGPSKSGSTIIIGTTSGARPVPSHPDMRYILTVYEKLPKKEAEEGRSE